MNTIIVTTLSKSFGATKLLDNINLNVSSGEIVGIFGRNGCGKSTMLKVLFGTMHADVIALKFNMKPLLPKNIIPQQIIGYLPQEPFLPQLLKVQDIIPMYYPDGDMQDKIFYSQGVGNISKQKIGNLSMGQLRYIELLLVGNLSHPFLMLDEPFSMVEPIYKDYIVELLLKLKQQKGIIITDHYYKDVLSVSNRNLLLAMGKLTVVEGEADLIHAGYLPSANS